VPLSKIVIHQLAPTAWPHVSMPTAAPELVHLVYLSWFWTIFLGFLANSAESHK
jgi:hypothetical protein